MFFQVKCLNCGTNYSLLEGNLEQCLQCERCRKYFFVSSSNQKDSDGTYLAEPLPGGVIKISCSKCAVRYELTTELIGQQVECCECAQVFIVKQPPMPPKPEQQSVAAKPIVEEVFTDDRTIKLKRPTSGKPQGMIPDYGPPIQNLTPLAPPQLNTPAHQQVNVPPQAQANISPQAQANISPQAQANISPQAQANIPPQAQANIPPQAQANTSVQAQINALAQAQINALAQAQANTLAQARANALAQAQANIPEKFSFFCPNCHLKYEVGRDLIGQEAECECGKLFNITVPITAESQRNSSIESTIKPSPPPRPDLAPPAVVAEEPIEKEPELPIVEEKFSDDRTVKLKRQANGKPQGMIPDYNLSMQKPAPVASSQVNIPAQQSQVNIPAQQLQVDIPAEFSVSCPKCAEQYDVTKDLIGEQAECECGCVFKVAVPPPPPKIKSPIKLTKKTSTVAVQKNSGSVKSGSKPTKPEPRPTPPSVPWYMFWKRFFGQS